MDYTKIIPHYTILYYIILYYTIYIILCKYIYIYYIIYYIHIYTYIIILFLEYLGSSSIWNRGIHWSIWCFFFYAPGPPLWRSPVGWQRGDLQWLGDGWLRPNPFGCSEMRTILTSQLSMGKIHGFSWDFMGFIRIYDGIPSGNLTVVCWWFYPLVMTNTANWFKSPKSMEVDVAGKIIYGPSIPWLC